jgi:hypothetical protein
MMKILSIFYISLIFSIGIPHASADEYSSELLMEVTKNARLREAPSANSRILAMLPGGFVVSIIQGDTAGREWKKVKRADGEYPTGFIHKSLLADPKTSYVLSELKQGTRRIKVFEPRPEQDLKRPPIWPQMHARLYEENGRFFAHLPSIKDLKEISEQSSVGFVQTLLDQDHMDSDFPFYRIYLHGGGNGGGISRFISKYPFRKNVFDLDMRPYAIEFSEDRGVWEISAKDDNYLNLASSMAHRALPRVVLKFSNMGVSLSEKAMIRPAPTEIDMKAKLANQPPLDGSDVDDAISILISVMLDFYYSGNPKSARAYFDSVWPKRGGPRNKKEFLNIIEKTVKSSRYYRPWMLED